MNISCRIANADTQCGRITNPPERVFQGINSTKNRDVEIIGNRILFNSGRYDKEKEQYMYFIQQ
jgi:hypothetical protein